MSPAGNSAAGASAGRLIKLICLLWVAGVAMRMTILAIPPVIPLVHDDLHLSETQIGLLIGLPLAVFAIAAVPGSLLIARIGSKIAVTIGMVIAAIAGGARGAAGDVWTLYATTIAAGFGVAIMQPAMPALVRDWLPAHVALGTIAYTAGMLMGTLFPTALTIPFVLPWVGGWQRDLVLWAVPALLIAPVFFAFSPPGRDRPKLNGANSARWWPNWKNPVVWLLGFAFGSNNSPFFATNAFLGDYLAAHGRPGLLGPALAWLNGSQIAALVVLIAMADRLQRRAWPFLLFGPFMLVGFLLMILVPTEFGIIAGCALVGLTTAVTLTATLALPPALCAPGDVPRTAAGMFTIAYTCAIIIPTICGGLWDVTGKPWMAFVPLCLCAVTLTVLGAIVSRSRPYAEKAPGR